MAERAIKARELFIKNPKKSQIDKDLLVWSFCEEDSVWYSILGNYSSMSPAEKDKKEQEREEKQKRSQLDEIQKANDYYEKVLFYSKIRQKVLERDGWSCQKCGKNADTKFHIHHILKKRKGGSDCLDNLITVCPKCHHQVDSDNYDPEWQ
jgi:5-methylcytosine-specific restriction endonuclease McrA